MKVSELEGALLDYWVAHLDPRCAGLRFEWRADQDGGRHWVGLADFGFGDGVCCFGCQGGIRNSLKLRRKYHTVERFSPSTDWPQGGPIIDKHIVEIVRCESYGLGVSKIWYEAHVGTEDEPGHAIAVGNTYLESAMRAYVASKFGDTVEDI